MTFAEAFKEAKRLWGVVGRAHCTTKDDRTRYFVGTVGGDMLANGTWAYGAGDSWEAAFADAAFRR